MHEVVRGSFVAFVIKVLGASIAFGFNILLARMLGADGAGIYYLALTVTTVASVISRVGLDNTLLRFTAANAAIEDWASVKGANSKGIILITSISFVLTLIIFFAAPWCAQSIFSKPELTQPLRWMALTIYPVSLFSVYSEMLRGLKRILDSQSLQGLLLPILNLAIFYLLADQYNLTGAVAAYVAATILTAVAAWWLWNRATLPMRGVAGRFSWVELLDSCLPLYVVALFSKAFTPWAPLLLLGMFVKSDEVGIFGVATRTAMLINLILITMNSIIAPKLAILFRQGEIKVLTNIVNKSTLFMMILALPPTLIFLIAPGWIMALFGTQFASGGTALAILALGQFVNVACGPVGYLLMMTGNERVVRNITFYSALVLGFSGLALIPFLGLIGAALSSSLGLIALNALSVIQVKKRLGILMIPSIHKFIS